MAAQLHNTPKDLVTEYDTAYLMAHIDRKPGAEEIRSDPYMSEDDDQNADCLPRLLGASFETTLEKSPKKQKIADSSASLRVEAPLQMPTASRDSVPFPEAQNSARPKAARRKAVFCDTATPEEAELERIFTSHDAAQETPDGA